jgi:hypothetical protein
MIERGNGPGFALKTVAKFARRDLMATGRPRRVSSGRLSVGDSPAETELHRRLGLRASDEGQLRRSFLTKARAIVMG